MILSTELLKGVEPAAQAADKFKMALAIEPGKHDALWCLGNAYTSQVRVLLLFEPL